MSVDKRWQVRIEHILEAIGKIQRYAAGLTEDTFAGQSMAVDAVIRNFQVIGEAVRHVRTRCRHAIPKCLGRSCRACDTSWCTTTTR